MPQLPTVGGDDGVWGTYLNDFLSVSLDNTNVSLSERGKLKPTAVDEAGAVMNTDTSSAAMSFVVDEDNMVSDSATKVPTQQSVKAYVDSSVTGSGGIIGPVSSTDNAVVRYDGITGKLAQNSVVTIGDTGNITTTGTTITLNTKNIVSGSGNLTLTDFNSVQIASVRNDNGNLSTIGAVKVLEWSSNTSNPSARVTPTGASQKALVVKGLSSQTGNLQEWQDSSGTSLMSVSSAGALTTTSPVINTGVSGTAIDTDTTLAANSDTILASQKAVKTYADTKLTTTTYNTDHEHALGMYGSRIGMNKWRLSTRQMKHIICWGDSVTQGVGVDSKTRSMSDSLRQILGNEFNEEVHEGFQPIFWGQSGVTARYTVFSGWTNIAGDSASNLSPHGLNGSLVRATSTTLRTITWTRPSSVICTRAIIYWVDDSTTTSGAKWSYSTDGGSVWTEVSTTSPGTPTLKTTEITGLDNPTDIRIRNANAAGTTYTNSPCFMGIDIRHGEYGWVVHNIGQAGSSLSLPLAASSCGAVSTARAGAWNTVFDLLQPELVMIEFSNDTTGYVQATYETAISTACSTLSAYADLVAYGFPDQSRLSGGADLPTVRAHTKTKVLAYNGVAIDMNTRWTNTANAQTLGFMPAGFFPIHPTELGDKDIASAIGRLLRSYG